MVVGTAEFKAWLKGGNQMKLSSDAAVVRVLHEGLTSYDSLADFDTATIQALPKVCREAIPAVVADVQAGITAENAVVGANVNSVSVQRLIVAAHATRYYRDIQRASTPQNMHYTNVLIDFKVEWDAYTELKKEDPPKIPRISDKLGDRKIIHWAPIFKDTLLMFHGPRGPIAYVLRDDSAVPAEAADPLQVNSYFGASGSLTAELVARLPHTGPIYKQDNTTVFLKIEEAARGTSVESTIKPFARQKDGRGAFLALIANHAGESKHRSIFKKRNTFLTSTKWTGQSHPFETHVSHHRQSNDDIVECAKHITVPVPSMAQRVEYLIDSITCKDVTLVSAIGQIRANTNNMRHDFEAAANALIEVDPYKRGSRNTNRGASISALDFSAGRGSTGVDLRFHPKKEYEALSGDKRAELIEWLGTADGKKHKREYFRDLKKNKKSSSSNKQKSGDNGGNWKKKMRQALKTDKGLKSVMSIMAAEEKSNQALVSALQITDTDDEDDAPSPNPSPTKKTKKTKTKSANVSSLTAAALPSTNRSP